MAVNVGIVGTGIYLPDTYMMAEEIAAATNGVWSKEAVYEKLGIAKKTIPGEDDGTQEMAVKAAKNCLQNTGVSPEELDLVLCVGEEYKEYPLTTSALYVIGEIGAVNAWGIDVQNRCSTTIAALKIAKDMLIADENIHTVMVVGGYRNGDLVDYTNKDMSMMFNLGAGGGAILLKKNYNKNLLLSTHIIADGSLARTAGVEIGGTINPITIENLERASKSLTLMDPIAMKDRLNEVSMKNWYRCIDVAFEESGIDKSELDYLSILHIKRSGHNEMIKSLGLTPEQTIYLEDYGHIGQIDQILSLHLALEQGKIKEGSVIAMIAAGIGYVWAANVIRWGEAKE